MLFRSRDEREPVNTDSEHPGIEGRQKSNNTYKIIKCKYPKARKEYQEKSISYKINCSREKPQKQEGYHQKKTSVILSFRCTTLVPLSLNGFNASGRRCLCRCLGSLVLLHFFVNGFKVQVLKIHARAMLNHIPP